MLAGQDPSRSRLRERDERAGRVRAISAHRSRYRDLAAAAQGAVDPFLAPGRRCAVRDPLATRVFASQHTMNDRIASVTIELGKDLPDQVDEQTMLPRKTALASTPR